MTSWNEKLSSRNRVSLIYESESGRDAHKQHQPRDDGEHAVAADPVNNPEDPSEDREL